MVKKTKQKKAIQYLIIAMAGVVIYGLIKYNIGVLFPQVNLFGLTVPLDYIFSGFIVIVLIIVCYLFTPDIYKLHKSSDLD